MTDDDSGATDEHPASGGVPDTIRRAVERNDAVERTDEGFAVTTTAFDATVGVDASADSPSYRVTVAVPTLDAATNDDVGRTVATDWFETFERRVRDAPSATRASVELDELQVTEDGESVAVRYAFVRDDAATAVEIAKTFAEFVEGTYVQGIVPGYEYTSPVSDLLTDASQGGGGGTPL